MLITKIRILACVNGNNVPAGNTGISTCTKTSAAPSGSFQVTFAAAGAVAPSPTAVMSILATGCPGTKVTVTCGAIPIGIVVGTVSLHKYCITTNYSLHLSCSLMGIYKELILYRHKE